MKRIVAEFSSFGEERLELKDVVLDENEELEPNYLNLELPKYQTAGSVGLDLKAFITEPVILYPFFRRVIPTGLKVAIKEGYEGQVRSRSGLAANNGIIVLNSPGTIDSDYDGEIKVILYNTDHFNTYTVNPGDRIGQMVFCPVAYAAGEKVAKKRGQGGFGSTGTE